MEATLTARDKKLLYMLGFIVIAFVFGWVLIRPIVKSINKTTDSIASAQALKQQNDSKVMGLTSAQLLVEKYDEDLAAATEEYYAPMDSSEIDKMFTMYVLEFGLSAKDLLISMPTEALEEIPYKYSDERIEYDKQKKSSSSSSSSSSDTVEDDIAQLSSTGTGTANSSSSSSQASADTFAVSITKTALDAYMEKYMTVKDTTAAGITAADVTIVLTGTEFRAQKLLDDLLVKPSIRVTGFAWDELPPVVRTYEDGSVEVVDTGEKMLTIRLKLYMYNDEDAGYEAPKK